MPECAASERMPIEPVARPTTTFMLVRSTAAPTELRATRFFSRSATRRHGRRPWIRSECSTRHASGTRRGPAREPLSRERVGWRAGRELSLALRDPPLEERSLGRVSRQPVRSAEVASRVGRAPRAGAPARRARPGRTDTPPAAPHPGSIAAPRVRAPGPAAPPPRPRGSAPPPARGECAGGRRTARRSRPTASPRRSGRARGWRRWPPRGGTRRPPRRGPTPRAARARGR